MFRYDYLPVAANLTFDFPNANFGRNRTPTENFFRVVANGCPIGRFVDGIANGIEMGGHLTNHNFNAYYKNNARNYTDEFERSWDSFKRATDIDYS